ncbi:MAG TPA: hypothetical protein VHZ97_13050 [Pseudonocardiaceae bacterium]|nr:hypothetical protein [Pseudonocardiaceae bacterium]
MPQLTDQQVAQYAYDAGFRGDSLTTATAVALAESHGDSGQVGDVGLQNGTWGPSVGLWQIRSLNPGHGTAAEQAQRDQTANLDPATNAQNAYSISQQGNNFNPWSTYTSGAYQQFNNRASTAAAQVDTGTQGSNTSQGSGAFHVAPTALTSTANEFSGQQQQVRNSGTEVSEENLSAAAFGQVPQSQEAYEAHHSVMETAAQTIQSLAERAGSLITGLNNSADNYIQGDQDSATSYQSLMTT